MIKILDQTQPRLAVLNHVLLFGVSHDVVLEDIAKGYKGKVEIGYDLMKINMCSPIIKKVLLKI